MDRVGAGRRQFEDDCFSARPVTERLEQAATCARRNPKSPCSTLPTSGLAVECPFGRRSVSVFPSAAQDVPTGGAIIASCTHRRIGVRLTGRPIQKSFFSTVVGSVEASVNFGWQVGDVGAPLLAGCWTWRGGCGACCRGGPPGVAHRAGAFGGASALDAQRLPAPVQGAVAVRLRGVDVEDLASVPLQAAVVPPGLRVWPQRCHHASA